MENSVPIPASGIWHIVWQLVEGNDLLASPALAGRISARLLAAHRPEGRELLHYLLAPTEMHLLSRLPTGESPSDVVREVGNIVARWVRQTQRVPGVVFAGRFRAYEIESDEAARDEFRMLAWRPVTLGVCKWPTQHATSSLRATLGLRRSEGFNVSNPLRLFGTTVRDSRAALSARVARRPSGIAMRQWEFTRGMLLAPGDAGRESSLMRPVQGLAAALVAASVPQGIDGALLLLERWVAAKLGLGEGSGLAAPHSLQGARVHALVAHLAVRLDLCSAASVARHFGRAKATLSERMAASRRKSEDRLIFGAPLERVVEEAIDLLGPAGESAKAGVNRPRTTR